MIIVCRSHSFIIMRLTLFFLLIIAAPYCFLSHLAAQSTSDLVPYRQGDLWGYAASDGKLVLPPQFSEAGLLQDDLVHFGYEDYSLEKLLPLQMPVALVHAKTGYGWLKADGRYALEPVSLQPPVAWPAGTNLFWLGRCDSLMDDYQVISIALFNTKLEQLCPFQYENIVYFESEDGFNPGCSNSQNQYVQNLRVWRYESDYQMPTCTTPYLPVIHRGLHGYIRNDGSEDFAPVWDRMILSEEGTAVAGKVDSQTGGISYVLIGPGNRALKTLPGIGEPDLFYSHGLLLVRLPEGGWRYMNGQGEWALPDTYQQAFRFTPYGWGIVQDSGGKCRIIDTRGKTLLELRNTNAIMPFEANFYIQKADGLWYAHDAQFRQTGSVGLEQMPYAFRFADQTYRIGRLNGMHGLLDSSDRVMLQFEFSHTMYDYNKTVRREKGQLETLRFLEVQRGNKKGLYNTRFEQIIPCEFDHLKLHHDTNYIFAYSNGRVALYDNAGRRCFPGTYDEIIVSHANELGCYAVRKDSLWGTFSRNGEPQLPLEYLKPPFFSGDTLSWLPRRGGWDFFDKNGRLLKRTNLKAEHIWSVKDFGCNNCYGIYAKNGNESFYANSDGNPQMPLETYTNANPRGEFITAYKDGKAGAVRFSDRKVVVPFIYEACYPVNGQFILKRFKEHDLQILNPKNGKIQTLPKIAKIDSFSEGLAVVHAGVECEDRNNYGFVDSNFQLVIPQQFSTARAFKGGLAAVRNAENRWGLIDRKGNWVVAPRFEKINYFQPQHRVIGAKPPGGKWGFIDRSGNWLLQPNMDEVYLDNMNGSEQELGYAKRRDAATGVMEFVIVNAITGKIIFEKSSPHPVQITIFWSVNLVHLENFPIPGKQALLKPDGNFLLENCDFITLGNHLISYIKDNRFQTLVEAAPDPSRKPSAYRASFEGLELQQLLLHDQSAIVDRSDMLLIPFHKDAEYWIYPKAGRIISRRNRGDVSSDFVVYDTTGQQISQFKSNTESFEAISTNLFRTRQGDNYGLIDLREGKEIVPIAYRKLEIIEKQRLIRVATDEDVYGYFDFSGKQYFSD